MAVLATAQVLPAALWPQGDMRDPLGVWAARIAVTGDATAGSIKVFFSVPAGLAAAYVYTCYALTYSQLSGAIAAQPLKARLLTNWPNAGIESGVQGFSTLRILATNGDTDYTSPIEGMVENAVTPNERFLLLFDPRPSGGTLEIAEMEYGVNTDTDVYAFEGYGYFWDRSVMQAPGGPRHPGSS